MKKIISKSMQKRIAAQTEGKQKPLAYVIRSTLVGGLPPYIIEIWTGNLRNNAKVAEIVFNTHPYRSVSECGCGAVDYDTNKEAIVNALIEGGVSVDPVPW